jgi:small-conductance mechanosensitive channel/CRP-like cAMP-binding protein
VQSDHAAWIAWAWIPLGLGAAIVLLGLLLARLAPRRRRALGRSAVLFVAALLVLAFAAISSSMGADRWVGRAAFARDFLEILIVINLAAAILFDLALPAVRIRLANIVSEMAVGLAYVGAVLWTMHSAGVNLSGLIATSALVTAVLGLSLQATLGNILGGLALQLDDSINVGDWIEMENKVQGRIQEIRWRCTLIETRDWDTLIVPNAELLAHSFKILGKREGEPIQHRMWVYFNVDFRYHPGEVIRVVEEALQSAPIEGVAALPPPNCICYDLAREGRDSFAHFAVRYWLTDLLRDDPTSSIVRTRIFTALRRANIPLAVPGATVFLSQDDPEHQRRKREREESERVAALDGVELLASMTPEEKARLASRIRYAPFSRGEVITRQGATAHWLYILTRGEALVRVEAETGEAASVAKIRAPSFFGEMGLMTGAPRTATVLAVTDVECLRLDKDDFHQVLSQRPEIAREISAVLAHRRVELLAVQQDLDGEALKRREESEGSRILASIQAFFGLGDDEGPPPAGTRP